MGQLDRSLDQLTKGVRLYPTASGWTRVGEVLAASGKKKLAVEAFKNALALDPLDEVARMRLAITWAELGEAERARALLRANGSGVETLKSLQLRHRLMEMLDS
jgi:Flp pilus assembly protein TadD